MTAPAKVKVRLRYSTLDAVAGDVISVDQETADNLVENGHATLEKAADKSDKG